MATNHHRLVAMSCPLSKEGSNRDISRQMDVTAAKQEYMMYRIESYKITWGQPIEQSIVMGMGLA